MASTKATADMIRDHLPMGPELENHNLLNGLTRQLMMWRTTLLTNTYVREHGLTVWGGLFKGMTYVDHSTEGSLVARLIGSYEAELHEDLLAFAQGDIDTVVDIGCAEGYYAVGLARLMPHATVHAFDTDPKARLACAELAEKNGVSDRVRIGETFTGDLFERFAGPRTLVMIDTEGFEEELMKPALWPALCTVNIIMETHPLAHRKIVETMLERFTPSHDIIVRQTGLRSSDLPPWLKTMPQLDQMAATWEFRASQTPWFVMRPKSGAAV